MAGSETLVLIRLKVRPGVPPLAGFTHVRTARFFAALALIQLGNKMPPWNSLDSSHRFQGGIENRSIRESTERKPPAFLTVPNGTEPHPLHFLSGRAVPFGIVNPDVRCIVDDDSARLFIELPSGLDVGSGPGLLE